MAAMLCVMNRSNVDSRTCRQPLIAANFPGRGIRCCCPGALPPIDDCAPAFMASTVFREDFASLANWTPLTIGNPAPAVAPAPEPGHPNAQSLASGAPASVALLAFGPATVDPSNPASQPNFSICWQVRQALPIADTGFVVGMAEPTLQALMAIGLDPGVSATNLILTWQSSGGPRTNAVTPFVLDNAWHAIHLERLGQGPLILTVDGVPFMVPASLGPGVLPAQPLQVGLGAVGLAAVADVRIDRFVLAF